MRWYANHFIRVRVVKCTQLNFIEWHIKNVFNKSNLLVIVSWLFCFEMTVYS